MPNFARQHNLDPFSTINYNPRGDSFKTESLPLLLVLLSRKTANITLLPLSLSRRHVFVAKKLFETLESFESS